MPTDKGQIGRIIMPVAAALLAVVAVTEAAGAPKTSSYTQTRRTAYDILRNARREPQAGEPGENAEIGPVVATARLSPASIVPRLGVGYSAMQQQSTTTAKPAELRDVPADAPPAPVYFGLDVDDRKVRGITYRSTDHTGNVKLFLDTDGDGLFSDERQYVGTWLSMFVLQRVYAFGPVSIAHKDGRLPASSFYIQCTDGRFIILNATRYHQGSVELDGRTYKLALVDCNYNGRYNDVLEPPVKNWRQPGCDTFAIDLDGNSKFDWSEPGESEVMSLSRLVKINQVYYHLDIADDGRSIEFRRAKPAFGTLDLGDENVAIRLLSDAGHQYLLSSHGKWRLPAGKYSAVELKLTRTDSAGNKWLFDTEKARGGAGAGKLGAFEVRPNETTSFEIGPPFAARTSMEKSGKDALVRYYLEGRAGELYVPGAKMNEKDVPEPQFQIIAPGGQTVHSAQFGFS